MRNVRTCAYFMLKDFFSLLRLYERWDDVCQHQFSMNRRIIFSHSGSILAASSASGCLGEKFLILLLRYQLKEAKKKRGKFVLLLLLLRQRQIISWIVDLILLARLPACLVSYTLQCGGVRNRRKKKKSEKKCTSLWNVWKKEREVKYLTDAFRADWRWWSCCVLCCCLRSHVSWFQSLFNCLINN